LAISRDDDWTGWCQFFLRAVTEQAHENQEKATEILRLYENKKIQVVQLTRSQYAIHALDYLFARPIFKASDFTCCRDIPEPTAKRMLAVLRDNGILKTLRKSSGRRAAIYVFAELLNTAEGIELF
jgi:Fic family protein